MNDLKSTKALVKAILEQDEHARNSDNYLYFRVIGVLADRANIDLNAIPVTKFLLDMNEFPFPPFESVRRTRQKAQEECPHLAACKRVAEARAENEVTYREFARG